MKNFPYKIESDLMVDGENQKGKTFWHSRACAVAAFIFTDNPNDPDDLLVLVEQRGPGAADFQGMICCPCGYVDFDETTQEAASREVFEETGVYVYPSMLKLHSINDSPSENLQNITLRYYAYSPHFYTCKLGSKGGELGEVGNIFWTSVEDLSTMKWAFGHEHIIKEVCDLL